MSRDLSIGTTGKDVAALQRLLNHHLTLPRTPLVPDGIFGPKTRARVLEFQTLNRCYPVTMPPDGDPLGRKPLAVDGIVGPRTLKVLLDVRSVDGYSQLAPKAAGAPARGPAPAFRLTQAAAGPAPAGDPQPQPPNPPRTLRIVQLQAGTQASVNPWVFSPLVLTAQYTLLAKNDGRPDFLLTAGGQVALNTGSANGRWSGQGFLQMGLGGFDFARFGRLDLLNPFVQLMLQKNDGQPATAGAAIGNQVNYTLISRQVNGDSQDVLSLFFNGQGVVNVGLNNGQCAAPSGQFLIGGTVSFF
jgi:peptidoglycan hydrolase-like protein with peptidoglycan-binding domain